MHAISNSKKQRILGFDPGSDTTGWALLEKEGHQIVLISCGHIRFPTKMSLPEKLHQLSVEAKLLLETHAPTQVVLESQFVGINPKSTFVITMARGVLMAAAAGVIKEVFTYSPTEAKKGITGKGNATKEEVQKMCRLLFRHPLLELKTTSFDTTDAIALAYCHLNRKNLGAL